MPETPPIQSPDNLRSTSDSPSELSLSIERAVRIEVEGQLAKEQKLLKESVVLAAKIVGAAATLFLAVFTIFGLTTWKDIKQEATELVKKQAEALIQKSDSETNVKETLNDLLNRTVVSSYLAVHSRQETGEVILPSNDWDRLRNWIKKEDLPLQDFSDALAVLNLQSDERKKTDANRVLAELLNPPEKSPYRWIRKQPEKTESILSNFQHKDLGTSALAVAASNAFTDSMRAKGAAYVQQVSFSDGVEQLLSVYKSLSWGDAKRNALVACVALRPDQPSVLGELKGLMSDGPQFKKTQTIADIIALMPRGRLSSDSTVNLDEFRALSKDLLLYAADNGLYFELFYPPADRFRRFEPDEFASSPAPQRPLVELMIATSKGGASGVGQITVAQLRNLEEYWKLLSNLANSGKLDALRRILLREGSFFSEPQQATLMRLSLTADAGAKVTVLEKGDSKTEVDLKSLAGASISSTGIADATVKISWVDGNGQTKSWPLVGLTGAGYVFSLERVAPK